MKQRMASYINEISFANVLFWLPPSGRKESDMLTDIIPTRLGPRIMGEDLRSSTRLRYHQHLVGWESMHLIHMR